MAYIISVNANITSESGGTCVCPPESWSNHCNDNVEYLMCVEAVHRDMVTATAAIAALSTFCMGLFANLPVALAPGMGLNAYFAYTVVGRHGFGMIPYEVALTAVFVEGWVFLGLTILGIRQWLARALPASIKLATGTGIGLYLTLIGLTYSAGIGLVTGAKDTPIELAGCAPEFKDPATGLCPDSAKMRNPTMWIGIFCGGVLTAILMLYRVKGAVIIGILLVSIISWPRPTPVTYFPYTKLGNDLFDFFKQVVTFHPIQKTLAVQNWDISGRGGQFGLAFITFLVCPCVRRDPAVSHESSTSIFSTPPARYTRWRDSAVQSTNARKISKAAPLPTYVSRQSSSTSPANHTADGRRN